jgi:molybdopterin molybdotransferase
VSGVGRGLWSLEEALERIAAEAGSALAVRRPLAECLGARLVEDVRADADSPPFDKALVDGYALGEGGVVDADGRRWRVVEEVDAGRVPCEDLGEGRAALVMTGAPLPRGTVGVVMHEEATRAGDDVWLAAARQVRVGENVLERGREYRAGEVVLGAGSWLDAAGLGVLASVGCGRPLVHPRPRVAIATTGDELVGVDESPGPGRIRNSNAHVMAGLVESLGGIAVPLGIGRDRPDELERLLARGLDPEVADVLVVSGGVSAGRKDLVPGVLEGLGVRTVLHKVRLRPGKPMLFGVGPGRSAGGAGLVFGLPGNPVSSLVCFLLFVAPALGRISGGATRAVEVQRAGLRESYQHRGERPTFHPARLDGDGGVTPLPWAGSPDLRTVAGADGFARFAAGDRVYPAGTEVEVMMLPGRRR